MKKLEEKLKLEFSSQELLKRALTHSSYANENNLQDNERLEFLGDAVIELLSSDMLFKQYKNISEGDLTKKRAKIVCEEALYFYSKKMGLDKYILLGKGEESNDGRNRPSILSDCYEALFGAIFIEYGFEEARRVFNEFFVPYLDEASEMFYDYKSELQELVQSDKRSLTYKEVDLCNSNIKKFYSEVYMDEILMGSGEGKSKKKAQQQAAKIALEKLARGNENFN